MIKYADKAFKAYDIRGIVETDLKPEVVTNLGKVLGTMALEAGAKALVVARDGRLSSPSLSKSLITGVLASGCDVFDIGEVPTPLMYFATFQLKTGSGVMITGSHNPPEYNGFKMMIGGSTVYGEQIQTILQRLKTSDYIDGKTAVCQEVDITGSYIDYIVEDVKLSSNISVVIDCGNGVAGGIAPKLYRRMGAKVLGLFCDVDGNFPNHHPDPSKPENLKDLVNAVKNSDAAIGLAFDGDGDRLGVVAKDGNIIYPDRQMMLFAADVLENNPGGKVIYDVKSTSLLKSWIEENSGVPILSRTGHSFIKAKIKETGAILAGEMSGHFFFNDRWFGFDDGIYAGARMLEVLSKLDNPSELLNALPAQVSTPEINIDVASGNPHAVIEELSKNLHLEGAIDIITIDGIRVEYADGFGLVRASNTTPVLVLRFEGETVEALNRIKKAFYDLLLPYMDKKLLEILI